MQSGLFNRSGAAPAASPAASFSPAPKATIAAPSFGGASVKAASPAPVRATIAASQPPASPGLGRASFTPAPVGPTPPQGEAALLKAWHAQQKEIDELKKKIAQLEGR